MGDLNGSFSPSSKVKIKELIVISYFLPYFSKICFHPSESQFFDFEHIFWWWWRVSNCNSLKFFERVYNIYMYWRWGGDFFVVCRFEVKLLFACNFAGFVVWMWPKVGPLNTSETGEFHLLSPIRKGWFGMQTRRRRHIRIQFSKLEWQKYKLGKTKLCILCFASIQNIPFSLRDNTSSYQVKKKNTYLSKKGYNFVRLKAHCTFSANCAGHAAVCVNRLLSIFGGGGGGLFFILLSTRWSSKQPMLLWAPSREVFYL